MIDQNETGDTATGAHNAGLPYVVVRTNTAGAWAGYLQSRPAQDEARLVSARRLWMWDGAASLSELAIRGTSKPKQCKFPGPVSVNVLGVIEIIDATSEARESIEAVPEWTAR